MTKGKSSVCLMAKSAGVPVFPYDIGMVTDVDGVTSIKTMYGTNDFYNEPAMTYETAQKAVLSGINTAIEMYNRGYDMIATGEMGIGNTTTSSAVTAVFTGSRAEDVTGRGAGLSDEALARKIHVIEHGIKKLNPNKNDVIDVISKVGGLDIAGMAGLFIGGAYLKIPVIIDGFISGVAALTATRLAPACADYMIASHMSKEPGASKVYEMLLMKPLMSMGMALGEGTGAVTVIPLIKMAVSVYFGMPTFDKLDMEAYVDYDKK
jgi:nicotinate-nucleotide--dimethylbenzimidazole phosphoribosyltransferase